MSEMKVLATVNGVQITEEDVEAYILKLPKNQQAYAAYPQFREQVLDQIIALHLFAKKAEEDKLDQTKVFEKLLADTKRDLLAQMSIQSIMEKVTVTDEEAKAYYDEHKEDFNTGAKVGARHILVDSEEKCQSILEELNKGEKSFEDAAKEYSSCPSKAEGGDLGEFSHGQMVPEFDKAAFEAEVDQLVGPVKTQFGYHLIKVYKKTEGEVPAFEAVHASIKTNLLQGKQNAAYDYNVSLLKEKYMKD